MSLNGQEKNSFWGVTSQTKLKKVSLKIDQKIGQKS